MAARSILYLSPIPYLGGGAELSLLGIVRHLDRDRFRPFVVLPPGPVTDLAPELEAAGARVAQVPMEGFAGLSPAPLLTTGWALSRLVKEWQVDLIHGNAAQALSHSAVASAFSRRPAICHFRERIAPSLFQSRTGRWCLGRMKTIVVVSRACAQDLPPTKLANKVIVIHNGIETDHFRPDPQAGRQLREQLQLPPEATLIGIVGQVAPGKGHEDLLQVVPHVLACFPNALFLIVGDDRVIRRRWGRAYMEELQALVLSKSVSQRVRFLGHHPDVAPVIRGLDILVVPSMWEPFGRVVIEGMACGICVIATRSGGPPEIIEDGRTGLLVPPANPSALATAITAAIASPRHRKAMGDAARTAAVARFSARQNCQAVMAVYDTILGATPGGCL